MWFLFLGDSSDLTPERRKATRKLCVRLLITIGLLLTALTISGLMITQPQAFVAFFKNLK